jgi:hypothetical protein
MKKRIVSALVAGILAFTMVGTSSAGAVRSATATSYPNCDRLHKKWGIRRREVEEGRSQAGQDRSLQAACEPERVSREQQPRR